jgi:hypothetical protein
MIEGFWTAIFTSGNLSGGGVVYLSGGTLVGGDSQYFYLGNYQFNPQNQSLTAQSRVVAFVSGAVSVFGIPASLFDLRLDGKASGSSLTARGFLIQNPALTFSVQLLKRTGSITPIPGSSDPPIGPWTPPPSHPGKQ